MAIPYREWFLISRRAIWYNSADNAADTHDKWADSALETGKIGHQTTSGGTKYYGYYTRIFPVGGFGWDAESLDDVIDYRLTLTRHLISNTAGAATAQISYGICAYPTTAPDVFSFEAGTGRHYDGVTDWESYPHIAHADGYGTLQDVAVGTTESITRWGCSYKAGFGADVHPERERLARNGFILNLTNYDIGGPFADNEACFIGIDPVSIRLRFHNPVVNTISRNRMKAAGGVSVVLTGLGFNNDDTEITNTAGNSLSATPAGGWGDAVTHIYFRGRGAAPDYTLVAASGHFTVDSNTQITIASMPAMAAGAYEIFVQKRGTIENHIGTYPGGYAGDWNAEADGRLYRGNRFVFYVGAVGTGTGREIVLTKWKFKNALTEIFKYYAPIDVTSPDIFYDGRILRSSSVTRQISDKSGLFTGADMDFNLSNADKEFSKLLAEYILKNQVVQVFYAWSQGPEGWKTSLANLIVDDYALAGPEFSAKLRDISAMYFRKKVPLYYCTADEYPNIHENAVGKPMPEILGLAYSAAADNAGAVEAVYIDTANYKYLGARGSLYEITAVYGDGVLIDPADYAVSYEDGGRTYITFTADQGNKKITFNCKGYTFGDWNSASGYVQNPAWVTAFFLAFLAEVPEEFLNLGSFSDLAAKFTALGFELNGKLIIQKESDAESYLKELLYTYGAISCFDKAGRFKIDRKDISDFATDITIFAQIDTLEHPIREFNTGQAFNRMKARWDLIPAADYFLQSQVFESAASISDLGQNLEPSNGADFPWTDSAVLVAMRAQEELLRYGYGNPRYRFSLALNWIDTLDLMTTFKLQDPYAVDASGAGDVGRYCYVETMTIEHEARRIEITAVDLSYLLRLYLVLGDPASLADNYATATEWMRMYAYLCDSATGRFANGDVGKRLL